MCALSRGFIEYFSPRSVLQTLIFTWAKYKSPTPLLTTTGKETPPSPFIINITKIKCVCYKITSLPRFFFDWGKVGCHKFFCVRKSFKNWFFLEANTRTLPSYEQQQENKKLPHTHITLRSLGWSWPSSLWALGPPKEEEGQVSSNFLFKWKTINSKP